MSNHSLIQVVPFVAAANLTAKHSHSPDADADAEDSPPLFRIQTEEVQHVVSVPLRELADPAVYNPRGTCTVFSWILFTPMIGIVAVQNMSHIYANTQTPFCSKVGKYDFSRVMRLRFELS